MSRVYLCAEAFPAPTRGIILWHGKKSRRAMLGLKWRIVTQVSALFEPAPMRDVLQRRRNPARKRKFPVADATNHPTVSHRLRRNLIRRPSAVRFLRFGIVGQRSAAQYDPPHLSAAEIVKVLRIDIDIAKRLHNRVTDFLLHHRLSGRPASISVIRRSRCRG